MGSIHLNIFYRPLKVGFLIRDHNVNDLVKAAQLNCLLWGGMYNPIIPVKSDSKYTKMLIETFSVDVLYPIVKSKEINKIISHFPALKNPHIYGDKFFTRDSKEGKQKITILDIINLIKLYWEEEFKHKATNFKSHCKLVKWSSKDELSKFFAINFGKYPANYDLEDNFEKIYLEGMRAEEQYINLNNEISASLDTSISPINLTSRKLLVNNTSIYNYGIFVGNENNFEDLITFWNLRASGIEVIFISNQATDRFKEYVESYLNRLKEKPMHSIFDKEISIYYNNIDAKEVDRVIRNFSIPRKIMFHPCDYISWNGLNIIPSSTFFDTDEGIANVDKSFDRYRVTINLPNKKFIKEIRKRAFHQALSVHINPFSESYDYPNHLLKVPFFPSLNEYYSRNICLIPNSLRVQRDGISKIIEGHDGYIWLRPISYQSLIEKIYDHVNISSEISQAGLITTRIFEKLEDLEGSRVFKIRGVRSLFQNIKTTDCITRGKATETIWNNGQFKEHEDLHIEKRNKLKLESNDVFDFLLKKDFYRAGLELICNNCKLKSWLSLQEIKDIWGCNYCGYNNQTSLHLRDRGDWKYRKSGLFEKDNNQEGAIPVLITLLQLNRIFHDHFIHAFSMNLSYDSINSEIDFTFIHYFRSNDYEFGIGECKSDGGFIDQNDIDNMVLIREKLKKLHINSYLIFSKTADSFESEEIERFQKLYKSEIPLVLFTNKELEPYHPYWDNDSDNLPQKYPHSLAEMSQNSYHRYLIKNKNI